MDEDGRGGERMGCFVSSCTVLHISDSEVDSPIFNAFLEEAGSCWLVALMLIKKI